MSDELKTDVVESTDGASAPAAPNLNAEAKKLPWVRDLMQQAKELQELRQSQKDAQERAELERAESEGNYRKALELAEARVAKIEADTAARIRKFELETEFVKAGCIDPRVVRIFEADYDPETGSVSEYVAQIKADDANALYFGKSNKRTVLDAPPATSGTSNNVSKADLTAWSNSSDPKLRLKAANYKAAYFDKHGKLPT